MESSAVIAMNEEYKEITGEEVYLYASKPKGGTLYVFCNAQIPSYKAAEEHMLRMLQEARKGRLRHQDIVRKYQLPAPGKRGSRKR